jgi:hypothetical protein
MFWKRASSSMDQFLTVNQGNFAMSAIPEIRNARNSDNGSYLIELASSQDIIFYSDSDADGKAEKTRYYLDGDRLMKSVIEPVGSPATYPENEAKKKSVAENIRNGAEAMFFYYNGNWPQQTTADVSEIRMVQIFLRVNSNSSSPQTDYILDTFSEIRTIKDNL